jgi:hypothetical protein
VNSTRRARVERVGAARDQAPGFALIDQHTHRLLAHAGALGQFGQARAFARQVARDVDVRGADLRARREVRERQRHVDVVRH